MMERETLRQLIRDTIIELQRGGMLKSMDDIAYTEAVAILREYFTEDTRDTADGVTAALQAVSADKYYKILPMYFGQEQTIEEIAERLDVDVSTIVRNKKRLCLAVYNQIR